MDGRFLLERVGTAARRLHSGTAVPLGTLTLQRESTVSVLSAAVR